jgi:small-conductance mechanosensitive channel
MTLIRRAGCGDGWRRFALWAALLFVLALPLLPALAQQPAPEPVATALERIKTTLDGVEAALKNEQISARTLAELRARIVTARDELRARIEELEPRAAEVTARLKQLGPAPAEDAPAEEPAVAAERKQLNGNFSQIDGNLKQARLLAVRTDQLGERISERRRALYARELLERGASALDPFSWMEAAEATPGTLRSLGALLQSWAETAFEGGVVRIVPAALLLVLILAAAIGLTRWWLPRFAMSPRADTRFARARTAVMVFVWLAARTPLALLAAIMVLDAFSLLTYRMNEIAHGLVAAVVAAAFGRGVAQGLLAPEQPARRIVALDDHTAGCFHDHLVWSTRVFGLAIFLQVVNKTLFAPIAMTVAANALFATAIVGLLIHLVRCLRKAELVNGGDAVISAPGARLAAWMLGTAIVLALITGYAALAAFIALRTVVAAAVLGALYLLLVATDALFTEALAPETPLGRRIAANLGLPARSVALLNTLLSAGIRVALILLALLVIFGPWEVSTADLVDSVQSIPLGLQIGEITISFRAVLGAAAALIVVLLITRAVQRWLQREFLPRTTLEPSLQLSISTIFGYVGAITAVMLAMAGLGIDLQKIALVAGALSVGIGFGLQSIVSNFVCGLILLAERPIRVGDAIVVGGEEGSVRRIRVRATEIETPQRASVIIPNSVLITGMVKNWTHANTLGQIILKIGVGYDSDAEQVRELLLSVAGDHPQITKNPAPGAFFVAFGDSALEFELRCVVANVANGLSVRSELNLEILKRCRATGIEIPYPQREVRLRGAAGDGEALDAPATRPAV